MYLINMGKIITFTFAFNSTEAGTAALNIFPSLVDTC